LSKEASEKIERYKLREDLKNWELVHLKSIISPSKGFKGIFNIMDNSFEFEITKKINKGITGRTGYAADLKEGGYAILSIYEDEINASIWYMNRFFSIEFIENGVYFITETDMDKITQNESPNDYNYINNLKKSGRGTSGDEVQTSAIIKVFVAYTDDVAQNYDELTLINNCYNATGIAFYNSSISSEIDIVGYQEFTYSETGNSQTDCNNFMTNNDGILDAIHCLRNQYEADICILLVNSLNDGTAWWAASIGAEFTGAFCVVKASAAVSNKTFPHELAHLLGCRHDIDSGTDPYAYAHGYYWNGKLYNVVTNYRTIMGVNKIEASTRVPYFSNPNTYDQLNKPMGTIDTNYCAMAIDDYASYIDAFQPLTTSGTMSKNELWRGAVTVTGNVTIPSGITLTIDPGTTISFANNASLFVNGALNVNGTSGTTVTFSGNSTWGGITFNSGSYGNLNYCTITGVSTYGGAAIRILSASPAIRNCTIENNSTSHGIYLTGSTNAYIYNNIIRNNTLNGIYIYNGNAYLRYNTITGSSSYAAVYCDIYATPLFGAPSAGEADGWNTLQSGYYGLFGNYHCSINAGATDNGRYNTFQNNSYANVYASNYTTIYAKNNWWNPEPPTGIVEDATSSVYYTPYSLAKSTSNSSQSENDLLLLAYELRMQKRYSEALDIYDELINGVNNKYIILAISETGNLYRESKNSEVVDYIETVLQTKSNNPEVRAVLLEVLSNMYMTNKKYTDIISTSNKLVEDYGNNEHGKNGLMNIFYAYYYQQEMEKAFEVLESIDKKYAGNMEVLMARSILGLAAGSDIGGEYKAENNSESEINYNKNKPVEFELTGNYPNPFNPSTTINYSLPDESNVELIIYDIMGREVNSFIYDAQTVGAHNIVWNGRNREGANVSSGIYFYKLTAHALNTGKLFIRSAKMMLVK